MPCPTSFSLPNRCDDVRIQALSGSFRALTIRGSRVDVFVAIPECGLDGMLDLAWLGLPSSCRGPSRRKIRLRSVCV